MSRKLKGIAAAPGIAIAPLVHFHGTLDSIPTWKVAPEGVASEGRRLDEAVAEVGRSILALRKELADALSTVEEITQLVGVAAAQPVADRTREIIARSVGPPLALCPGMKNIAAVLLLGISLLVAPGYAAPASVQSLARVRFYTKTRNILAHGGKRARHMIYVGWV
jgi:hypothetical protein